MNLLSKPARLLAIVSLAFTYFAAARLGLSMAFVAAPGTGGGAPSGIAVAALVLFGRPIGIGVLLGAFLANVITNESVGTAAAIAAGNTLEAVLAATLIGSPAVFNRSLDRLRDVLRLAVYGAGVSTIAAATVGVVSLCAGGAQAWSRFGEMWWLWWIGDGIGVILVAPLLLTWSRRNW